MSVAPLERLLAIMAQLRDPQAGCEWDRAQSHATIVPHTIEEAYEVADAVARGDMARIAEEAGRFAFQDVAEAIAGKLEARHPHIFGDAPAGDEPREQRWEALKAAERSAKGEVGALDGVALALPALLRAEKLQKRAARVGFDWPDPSGSEAKVVEETAELAAATSPEERLAEAGDLLFAATNLVRAYGVSAEEALRAANAKFERRFAAMEALAAKRGEVFAALTLDQQEALWQAVKAGERL